MALTGSAGVTGVVHHANEESELQAVLDAANGKLVVIDFFAEWCGPCKAIAPQFEEWAKTHQDCVFVKVDVDKADSLTAKYEVSAMPTFKFVKGKEVVETVRGANPEAIAAAIKAHKVQLSTVDFGGAGSAAQPAQLELTRSQLAGVTQFTAVAEGADVGSAVATLAAQAWDAAAAVGAFFSGQAADAAPGGVAAVSEAVGATAEEPKGTAVKLQVRLGVEARDKHAVELPDSSTGQELLERVGSLLPPDTDFTLRVRVKALKKDVALGPADLSLSLPKLGLAKRGLVQVVPVNDDGSVKVLKKL